VALTNDIKFVEYGNSTHKMFFEEQRVIGITEDPLETLKQDVFKILNTERYQYIIYSWNYGIELKDLFGEPIEWVKSELKRRITEALSTDNRIESVDNFYFEIPTRNTLHCSFIIHSIYGNIEVEKVVNY